MLHRGEVKETITETHQYIYAGGKLLRETISDGTTTKTLDFTYDNVGMPYSLIYNNGTTTTTYYYVTNLQGDVMYLVDASGNEVAAYDYDPYGKIISATGAMAEINPLRYRGYYYDTETSFYYLQSRYYDPEICRFINADSYTSTGRGYLGYNMFAYCNGNPVVYSDPSGHALDPRFRTSLICDSSGKLILDRTKEVINELQHNYGKALIWSGNSNGAFDFYKYVKDNGDWDYKRQIKKSDWIPSNGVFKVFGKAMTAEELGNFNFGFTGTIVGFPDNILHWGAGIVAIKNNGVNWSDWRYSFDSKEDYMIIQQGINMANYITYRGYSVEEALEIVWK